MKVGEYAKAAKQFDEVERLHPYSTWATRATLMVAFAHYQRNAYQDSINASDRFIQLHPGNKDVAYAYYLKGLSYYEQIGDTERDQSNTQRMRMPKPFWPETIWPARKCAWAAII